MLDPDILCSLCNLCLNGDEYHYVLIRPLLKHSKEVPINYTFTTNTPTV